MTEFGTLKPNGQLESRVTLNLHAIEHDDKLAYGYGFSHGLAGVPMQEAEDGDELAEGYILGYQHGTRVRNGEPMPHWARR